MHNDIDLQETQEWREAFASLVAQAGPDRARFILDELNIQGNGLRLGWRPSAVTPYVNTIGVEQQPVFPGDLDLEQQLASLMRWDALTMVVRANRLTGELGGHIASYASAADLFEVGFNLFKPLIFSWNQSGLGVFVYNYSLRASIAHAHRL